MTILFVLMIIPAMLCAVPLILPPASMTDEDVDRLIRDYEKKEAAKQMA